MLAAAGAAGPWPDLGFAALAWRAPLALAASVLAFRPEIRRLARAAVVVSVAVLVADVAVPVRRPVSVMAAALRGRVAAEQEALAALTEQPRLRELLAPTGTEAEPEAAFSIAEELAGRLPVPADTVVIVDDSGLPVAWAGRRPKLPARLRPFGERAIVAERGVHETWVWWREPVLDAGRPLGGMLAGIVLPDAGLRRPFGVWAGRAAVLRVTERDGAPVEGPDGRAVVEVVVESTDPQPLSAPGLALALMLAVVAWRGRGTVRALAAAAAVAPALVLAWSGPGWWLVLTFGALAALSSWASRGVVRRLAGAMAAAAVGAFLPSVLEWMHVAAAPDRLVWPGLLRWALVVSLAILLRTAGRTLPRVPWQAFLAWVALLAGVWRADPAWLAAGAAAVALFGIPAGRGTVLPAAAAAALLLGADAAARRSDLVATTEATLARLSDAETTARVVLAGPPAPEAGVYARAEQQERVIALGRLAGQLRLEQVLPGSALVLVDPTGVVAATWGDTPLKVEGQPRELAARSGPDGWTVRLVAPAEPHDLLAALRSAGIASPVAVFDRSGTPVSRGATFRPLAPMRVGAALAAGNGWGRVEVGERDFAAYLRVKRDTILAVPWIRPPRAESALQLAGLTLWGAFPLGLWQRRRRFQRWWRERRTFTGRVRVLLAVSTVLPVLLLGQFLPQQWERQRVRARLELGRAVTRSFAAAGWEEGLVWLVREMGGTVALYRRGVLIETTRPDLAALGRVPELPPAGAYARAVRGWREPLVSGGELADVWAPLRRDDEPIVVGVIGLHVLTDGQSPTPGEWFIITGITALLAALSTTERLGQRLTRPLRRLVGAARRIERGDRAPAITPARDADVAALGRAFVTMAESVRRREEELRRERDLLDRVLRTLSAAVFVTDATGRIELANPAARSLLATGTRVDDLATFFGPGFGEVLARGMAGGTQENLKPAAAPEALWRVSVVPLPVAPEWIVLVLEDLSELARAERLSSLAELARIVAHEVKNPLTPIRLWAEELEASLERSPGDVVEVARVAAGQILERVAHLREVAQGFSNLVALEHWEAVDLDLLAIAREVADEYGVLAQRGVTVTVTGETAVTRADPQWVRRALRHLFENSARVLSGRAGTIDVTVRREGKIALLGVRDDGGGVGGDVLGRMFEPHFSTTTQGSGLGLAVVRRVAERAGGRAEARNVEGGLEIRLLLPAVTDGEVC